MASIIVSVEWETNKVLNVKKKLKVNVICKSRG